MALPIYRGFSANNWRKTRSFELTNLELVKQDLLQHIFTEKGQRVMMPGFGTRIPALAFEQNDESTRNIVKTDLTEVFTYDPRVKLLDLTVVTLPDNNALVAFAKLLYIEFNVTQDLRIDIPTL